MDYDKSGIDMSMFHHSAPNGFPKLYAIDIFTGMVNGFEADSAFLKVVNTTACKIASLDRAYLYLFIYSKENYGMTFPSSYSRRLSVNSVLSKKDIFSRPPSNYTVKSNDAYEMQMIDDIQNSDKWSIRMHVLKITDKTALTYRYTFSFGRKGRLLKVGKELLKKEPYKPYVNGQGRFIANRPCITIPYPCSHIYCLL